MDYIFERQPMISGQGEAVSKKYHGYVGKSGNIWLVADQPNSADNIYKTDNPENKGKHGFGGATLKLSLVQGGEFLLKGGWHSNADGLFFDTGVDVRNKHETFVVISKERAYDSEHGYRTILKDVLYQDEAPQIGTFNRGEEIAKRLANELGHKVFLYSKSQGGSSCGPVDPKL